MIALYDFIPAFCPYCGHETQLRGPEQSRDYLGHASHSCPRCGVHFAYCHTEALSKTAESEGSDLPQYAR